MKILILDYIFSQLRELLEKNPEKHTEILEIVKKFRDEEQEHHDTGLEHDAEKVILFNQNILAVFYFIII